ncbi:zinc-binding alcohol dehydrogenase [Wenyingzhuangia sp. IMCC45533]
MKLKEIPKSLIETIKILLLSKERIKQRKNTIPIIVSFTTIESRLSKVHITLRSLLNQTASPEKILLWVNSDLKNKIPKQLLNLTGDIFEIKFTHLHCSHKKLIHTIEQYPTRVIITCDDDFIYNAKWLETTYKEHLKFPNYIIGNQTRNILYDENGQLLNYKNWKHRIKNPNPKLILPIGANGVLYPPNVLYKELNNEKLFLKLAPKADDLWFKSMSLINNILSIQSQNPPPAPIPIIGTQWVSLKKENVDKDLNKKQWINLTNHFSLKF